MVFSGVTFLFYFLPVVLAAYTLATPRLRNVVLFLASLVFYVWGSGWLVIGILASVVIGYALGFPAERAAREGDARAARLVIVASVAVNLGLLAWFKYAGWFLEMAADSGLYTGEVPEIVIPVGISFFTFQAMSYTIDVARGRCHHLENPVDFGLYVTLFPQLLAGPIVRYHEIETQLRSRRFTLDGVGEGALRFGHGLAKYVIVADTIAPTANVVFGADTADLTTASVWVGVVAYTMQIYFAFSGFCDMAIGLGRMFGFRLPENFDRPYSALSITDFWRRWHVTLSNWMRDYVFIPLGGSRTATVAGVYRNLVIVCILTGLWYGSSWTFVAWGAYHGGWLLFERRFDRRHLDAPSLVHAVLRRARTLLAVMIGWVIFRADTLADALDRLEVMFTPDGADLSLLDEALTTRAAIVLVAACAVVFVPRSLVPGPTLVRSNDRAAGVARAVVMVCLVPASLLLVASDSVSRVVGFGF